MSASLDKLVGNLEKNQFQHTKQVFGDKSELLLRKIVWIREHFGRGCSRTSNESC